MKLEISHKLAKDVMGEVVILTKPRPFLFWKLKIKFYVVSVQFASASGGTKEIGSVCLEAHMTTTLSHSQDVWTGESSKGRFLEGY